jgi:DeoR/GlpR family transcriptional regulator of sugar metabolism
MANERLPVERHRLILEAVNDRGIIGVNELSRRFRVTPMTIRRDLMMLEEQGLLRRSHGGAISRRQIQTEPYFDQKGKRNRAQKLAIARAAVSLITPGETILVNSGSTTLELLRQLPKMELRVVTSNAGALTAIGASEIECIVIGGVYRPRSNSLVGGLAVQSLQQVFGSKSFIGVDGLDLKAGLTTPNHQEAEVARTMIGRTRGEVVVLADSSKIGAVAPFVTAQLEAANVIVTDTGITEEYKSALEELGLIVIVAEPITGPAEEGASVPGNDGQ